MSRTTELLELLEANISNADPSDETTFLHRWDWLIARKRNATIEECVAVVKKFDLASSDSAKDMNPLIIAIRALKEPQAQHYTPSGNTGFPSSGSGGC